jgi:pimeloyl-ACP methyl ester carboxylesterase
MTKQALPVFTIFRPGEPIEERGESAIVFIHGIYASHNTFDKMIPAFEEDRFRHWHLCWFDYDFHQPMPESAEQFAGHIREHFKRYQPGVDRVVIIGHSMGGLIGRLAILTNMIPYVDKLIMLGTPNFGAIRPSRLKGSDKTYAAKGNSSCNRRKQMTLAAKVVHAS